MKDSHTHLQMYPPEILPDVLRRARAAGVTQFGCCGTYPGDWSRVLEIAQIEEGVEPAFGVHPWLAMDATAAGIALAYEALRSFLFENPIAPVGEIGLDGARTNPKMQSEAFEAQLRLAQTFGRGVVLHCNRAAGEMTAFLKKYAASLPFILLHSPNITEREWREFAALGASVSIGASVLQPNRPRIRALARIVPDDKLFYETDSPEGRTAPEYIPRIIEEVRLIRSV